MDAAPLTVEPPDTATPPPAEWWPSRAGQRRIVGRPTADELPDSDGVPMDSHYHVRNLALLSDVLETHWAGRTDFFCGGDMFVYFSDRQVFDADFRGPDFFVVLGADHAKPRTSWVAWEEGDRLPNVIVEMASPSTERIDRGDKKELYRGKLKTPEYFILGVDGATLEGWRLVDGEYVPLSPTSPDGRLASQEIGLEFGVWDGAYYGQIFKYLRLYTADGRLLPTSSERVASNTRAALETAEPRRTHADVLAVRLDAEAARADAAVRRADALEETAEVARELAALYRQRSTAAEAELARLQAELAALRNPPPAS